MNQRKTDLTNFQKVKQKDTDQEHGLNEIMIETNQFYLKKMVSNK